MTNFGALVVGCGRIGSGYDDGLAAAAPLTHASAYTAHPRTFLLGGVDPDARARERFSRRWGVPVWGRLKDALSETTPDVVSVCTPASGRGETIRLIASSGARGVWLEKPMAGSSLEATAFGRELGAHGIVVQVNFHRRFDTEHRRIARAIRQDAEEVIHADCRYSGPLETYGIHGLDLFRWFVGECHTVEVACAAARPAVLLSTSEGQTASFMRVRGAGTDLFEWDMHTKDRRYTIVAGGEQVATRVPSQSALYPHAVRYDYGSPSATDGLRNALLNGVSSLIDAVEGDAPPLCTADDGIRALRIWEGVRDASENRRIAIVDRS